MTISADRPLQLDFRPLGQAIVITAHGSAEVLDAPQLQERLQRLVDRPDRIIVLDLSDLDFIGPGGLDALLTVRQALKARHGQIRLVNPNPEIHRLLQVSRLTEVFPIFDTVDQAVA